MIGTCVYRTDPTLGQVLVAWFATSSEALRWIARMPTEEKVPPTTRRRYSEAICRITTAPAGEEGWWVGSIMFSGDQVALLRALGATLGAVLRYSGDENVIDHAEREARTRLDDDQWAYARGLAEMYRELGRFRWEAHSGQADAPEEGW
jgi:hypothetical protein